MGMRETSVLRMFGVTVLVAARNYAQTEATSLCEQETGYLVDVKIAVRFGLHGLGRFAFQNTLE